LPERHRNHSTERRRISLRLQLETVSVLLVQRHDRRNEVSCRSADVI
jgi:hypothetical protein